MALSGDLFQHDSDKRPSIQWLDKIYFTDDGLVNDSVFGSAHHCLTDVIQVIEGDIEDVFPLIGHPMHKINSLLKNDVLTATDEVTEGLQKLSQRSPASLLLVHNNRLYGVVINDSNECRVVGQITSVVPRKEPDDGLNTVIVEKENVQMIGYSTDLNLKDLVTGGDILGIVALKGFAFIETDERTPEDMTGLVLVLSGGYILFQNMSIDWIRLQTGLRINEFVAKKTTIGPKDCVISQSSGFVREGNRFVVYGNQNAVLDFESFLKFGHDMNTVGFEFGETETDVQMRDVSTQMADSVISGELVESLTGSQEYDLRSQENQESDDCLSPSPDSFS